MSYRFKPEEDAGTAIEHTAVRQIVGGTFGAPHINRIYVPLPITALTKRSPREKTLMGSKQMINELKPGDRVESYFSVNYKKPVTEYKYGFMFEFRVADKSGQMTVKYWGGQARESIQKLHDSFEREDVVQISGEAQEYRDQIEISVSEKNGGTMAKLPKEGYDATQLVKAYDNIPEMRTQILELVETVRDPHLGKLLRSFFMDEEFARSFSESPASITLHSAAVGGLLRHTLNVAELCLKVKEIHPELDRDLLLAGALLHDIGKVQSFRISSNISQTEKGNLIGHITIGDHELVDHISMIDGFPDSVASKLRHILLSHHGKKEWGSPVEPMFPEALAVHEADDLDAKLDNMITKREDAVTEDDWIWDPRHGRLIFLK
jgi:3'-5' exoribonuclease